MTSRTTATAARREGLPRGDRILSRRDFLRVQREGRRVHTQHFVLIGLRGARRRLGVTASRRVGHAVRRNRIKRIVREVFRRNRSAFPARTDVLVVARAGAATLGYEAACAEITSAGPALTRALRTSEGSR